MSLLACAQRRTRVFAQVRGKRLPMTVSQLPFVRPKYKRSTPSSS